MTQLIKDTCRIHDNEVGKIDQLDTKLEVLITDIRWIKKFGVWIMGVVGGAVVLMIPFLIAFAVYVHSLDTRLSVVEQAVKDHVINTTPNNIKKVLP